MARFSDSAARDRDETRRLLYMADLASRTKKYNLAGTLVNALVHHHVDEGLDAGDVARHVVAVLEGGDGEQAGRAFLLEQIARISRELGD
jgi:hypothetical protein